MQKATLFLWLTHSSAKIDFAKAATVEEKVRACWLDPLDPNGPTTFIPKDWAYAGKITFKADFIPDTVATEAALAALADQESELRAKFSAHLDELQATRQSLLALPGVSSND